MAKIEGTVAMIRGLLQPLPPPQMWQLRPRRPLLPRLRLSSMQLSVHQKLPQIVEPHLEIPRLHLQPQPHWDLPKICSHNTTHLHYLLVQIENNLIVPPTRITLLT